ncbi:MAG: glycosyltransferase family protein [Crocinitomicaceae bacterium]|nr:glycosyltransferase family protein [Crocinitomicaceae bacterium]
MNLLITQARMGSTRLPGKVLKTIKGHALLELQMERIKAAKMVDKIVIATTTDPNDDPIEVFCKERGIDFYRGSEQDVLDRYYQVAKKYNPDIVIRITSDCPLHHHEVIDFVIDEYQKSGKDYFSNSNNEPDFLEDGFDVEVFSFEALETAWKEAKMKSEREHVTVYIKNCGKFECGWKKFNPNYTFKLSVDSPADFKLATTIFESFDSITEFGLNDVVSLLERKPELLKINKDSEINSGFKKSLRNDKIV